MRDIYRRELEKVHDTRSGQAAGPTHESKWHYFTRMSFVNAVMIQRLTLSNVPAASSVLGSTQNLEDGSASTKVSMNDNDNDEFSEGGGEGRSDKRQVKINLWTERKKNLQEEALHLEKRKIKLKEERLMKKSQADEDTDYMFRMILLPSIKSWMIFKDWNSK